LDILTLAARYLHIHNDSRDPSSERWNCVGENWQVILPEIATSTSIQGSFMCYKSATWDTQLYFLSEGRRAEDFFTLKFLTALAGVEPANLGTYRWHPTPRPTKPLKP